MAFIRNAKNNGKSFTNRFGKHIVKRENQTLSEIQIGKGTIAMDEGVQYSAEGRYLVLTHTTEKGPCPDNLCQLRGGIEAMIQNDHPGSSYRVFKIGSISFAMDEAVFSSIDRGRENVTIKNGRHGDIVVKGFTLAV